MRRLSLFNLLLPMCVASQSWNLAGKIVDSEEGDGVKGVRVVLARAGLEATTDKGGSWYIGST